jgi:dTDP-4-amino-4,6-dideoxygalactose transaminase
VRVPFNKPSVSASELDNIRQAVANMHLSGNGPFTRRCETWLEQRIGCQRALLTQSCTAALEMCGLLADLQPGDEVIMPSFTFVSTANAFVLRGAVPVFVDVRPDTLNIDERGIAAAITPRTRAIVVVHYGAVSCPMDDIDAIATQHGLVLIEDAAHGILATYRNRPLGSFGHAAALSFHETKNVTAGEGGALLVNDAAWVERAEIVWEKGTNRRDFSRGQVARYTWVDIGSSFTPSEINAAVLCAQLDRAELLTRQRLAIWAHYHAALEPLERAGVLRRPIVPAECVHNAHLYYVLLTDARQRSGMLAHLNGRGINAVSHYVPLHSAPAGRRFGRVSAPLPITDRVADQLVRLPLWADMGPAESDAVVAAVLDWAAAAC